MSTSGRRGARRLLLQALYQHQLAGHDCAELLSQFGARAEFSRIDTDYFTSLLEEILARNVEYDSLLQQVTDRPVAQLDPVEHAILWIGVGELDLRWDIPTRVVINECVNLAHAFGAQDGHRFVNALLDRLARGLRAASASGPGPAGGADG